MPAPSKFAKFSVLLSLALVVVLLASPAPAHALSHGDHFGHHKRMVKVYNGAHHKRADDGPVANSGAGSTGKAGGETEDDIPDKTKINAAGIDDPPTNGGVRGGSGRVSGAGADPNESSASASTSSAPPTSTSNTPIIPLPSLSIGESSVSESASTSASVSESSSVPESSSTISTSESTSTSTTVSPTSTPPAVSTPPPVESAASTPVVEQSTRVVHVGPAATAPPIGAAQTTSNIRKTLTVLISLGASIAVVAIAWNLFRRWKLRPSKSFESRTAPIDWQPNNEHDETMFEKQQRRRMSGSSFRSFDSQGHSVQTHTTGHGGMPPAHDFTAGQSHLAVNGGYADLQRGRSPSPGPQMMQQHGGYRDYHQGY